MTTTTQTTPTTQTELIDGAVRRLIAAGVPPLNQGQLDRLTRVFTAARAMTANAA